ncbi:hypothetical protein BH11PLA2_BH11PLA2_06670 [soil metagenome]
MIKFLFVSLLVVLTSLSGWTQTPPAAATIPEGQRVFVCAHSFMIFTAKTLPPIAESAKIKHIAAGQQMIGGSQTIQHWNLPDEKNMAKKALREGTVDVFVCSPLVQIPDRGIDNFTKLGLEKNPKLRVLVQASWVPRDGTLLGGFKNAQRDDATLEKLKSLREVQAGYTEALLKQVTELNKASGKDVAHIIPVGDAVITLREKILAGQVPGLAKQTDLFSDDLGHAKSPLVILVTYCHYAAIYKQSPEGLPVPKEIKAMPKSEEMNKVLQEIAWKTVSEYEASGVKAAKK